MTLIAVTGSTGKIASRVAASLSQRGVEQLLVGRDPDRLPDLPGAEKRGPAAYDDIEAMAAALQGADTLLLVSAGLSGRRPQEHMSAMDAAIRAGVGRIVYVSLLSAAHDATYVNARDHRVTEEDLAELGATKGVRWTVLRAGWFASMLPLLADEEGVIRAPAGEGKVAAVTHDDIAAVAVGVLADDTGRWDGQVLEITGPEALGLDQVAERLTTWSGRPHSYVQETFEEGQARRRALPDAGEEQVQGWLSWHLAIARGEVDLVTDVVDLVTGHHARPVEDAWGSDETQVRIR